MKTIKARKRTAAEYRALTVFETLPDNHRTFAISDHDSDPHLRSGEYAVVDTGDLEPQSGELFLLQMTTGPRRRYVMQVWSRVETCLAGHSLPTPCWYYGDLARPRTLGEMQRRQRKGTVFGLVEGPLETNHLRRYIVGRVVGVAFASHGSIMAPTAGWENEDAGNAAFDAAEYLDVLLSVGYLPQAVAEGDGEFCFRLMLPAGPVAPDEDAEALRVITKYSQASLAGQMVIAECRRRNLVA